MALSDIVRQAVALADTVSKDLQATVTWHAWTGADNYGVPTYAAAVSVRALVEHKQRMVRTAGGQEVQAKHKVTLLQLPRRNAAAHRRQPIDPRDKLVLPDGQTGPIVDTGGFVDAGSAAGAPYLLELWLA